MAVIHKRYWVERCGTVGAVAICSRSTRHVFRSWEACKESKWPFWHLTSIPEDIHEPLETHYVDPLTGRSVRAAAATRWWHKHGGYWTKDRDNAAKTWYYETYVKPRLKKEFE